MQELLKKKEEFDKKCKKLEEKKKKAEEELRKILEDEENKRRAQRKAIEESFWLRVRGYNKKEKKDKISDPIKSSEEEKLVINTQVGHTLEDTDKSIDPINENNYLSQTMIIGMKHANSESQIKTSSNFLNAAWRSSVHKRKKSRYRKLAKSTTKSRNSSLEEIKIREKEPHVVLPYLFLASQTNEV